MTNTYSVPCPECGQTFVCEYFMMCHQTAEHLPQLHGFIGLAAGL